MQLPEDEVKAGAPDWVVTFGDMMSLLLTFFVLLLSFSSMEAERFKMISGYMREAFGLQTKDSYSGVPMGTTILSTDARTSTQASDDLKLIQVMRRQLEKAGLTQKGSVEATDRGVAVRIDGEVLFDSGRSELKTDALGIVDSIATLAAERSGMIEVEGHTDDIPITTPQYPSNWELSGARAGSTARYLVRQGVPDSRIKAIGYADTRPIVPNSNPENRAKNRRVEFLFARNPNDSSQDESSNDPASEPDQASSSTSTIF